MGFYSPQSLVADARRHGVTVHGPDINISLSHPTLELPGPSVRLGIGAIRSIGDKLAERIVDEREENGPYRGMVELAGRIGLTTPQLEALATAGAFSSLGLERREALWAAGAAARERAGRLPGTVTGTDAPMLPGMDEVEVAAADVWATGVSPDSYPIQFVREKLRQMGAVAVADLSKVDDKTRVLVGGAITHRQRPATAGGVTFLNVEDETGMLNVVCSEGLWRRYRRVARTSSAVLVRGVLTKAEGVLSLQADQLRHLDIRVPSTSRDFR
jgi:error-prone DNA polymerase